MENPDMYIASAERKQIEQKAEINNWAQLFKTNDVVS